MNTQPIEKRIQSDTLFIHSIFHTIQGEGPFCGTPAIFIRLSGCNLQCPSCDTDYTSKRTPLSPIVILDYVRDYAQSGLVVITGGEPFRQNLTRLLNLLTDNGYYVQVETNGTLEPSSGVQYCTSTDIRTGVYVVCSPKTGKVNALIEKVACAYKYVLSASNVNYEDGLPLNVLGHPSSPHVARPPKNWHRPVYLQPEDSKSKLLNQVNLDAVIHSCMNHGYILQLQVHKIINME